MNILIGFLIGFFGNILSSLVLKAYSQALNDPKTQQCIIDIICRTDRLRTSYVEFIRLGLDLVDRFMGDANTALQHKSNNTLKSNRILLYFTAPSFDKCALLALIYPILSMFVVWFWWGKAGDIGTAIGLRSYAPFYYRLFAFIGVIMLLLTSIQVFRYDGWRRWRWSAFAVASAALFAYGFAGANIQADASEAGVAIAFIVAVAAAVAKSLTCDGGGAGALAGAFAVGLAGAAFGPHTIKGGFAFAVAVIASASGVLAVSVTLIVIHFVDRVSTKHFLGPLWAIFWIVAIGSCYFFLWQMTSSGSPEDLWFMLTMICIVPLANIPFDWASVGLTRTLLRWGCEKHSPPMIILGIGDFIIGLFLLVLLAIVLIIALDTADWVSKQSGQQTFVGVQALIKDLGKNPHSAANIWIYVILLSTLIPSVLNVLVSLFSVILRIVPINYRKRLVTKLKMKTISVYTEIELLIVPAGVLLISILIVSCSVWLIRGIFPDTVIFLLTFFEQILEHFGNLVAGALGV